MLVVHCSRLPGLVGRAEFKCLPQFPHHAQPGDQLKLLPGPESNQTAL